MVDPLRVLIADDDAEVRAALTEMLSSDPRFDLVGVAGDADEAIATCTRVCPDLALLDVAMPGGGGVAAALAISSGCPRTRIVALSARRDRATMSAMLAAGAVAFLSKSSSLDLPAALLELHAS